MVMVECVVVFFCGGQNFCNPDVVVNVRSVGTCKKFSYRQTYFGFTTAEARRGSSCHRRWWDFVSFKFLLFWHGRVSTKVISYEKYLLLNLSALSLSKLISAKEVDKCKLLFISIHTTMFRSSHLWAQRHLLCMSFAGIRMTTLLELISCSSPSFSSLLGTHLKLSRFILSMAAV